MGPIELVEGKDKLHELEVKGFIRPSTSPYGELVLLIGKMDRDKRESIDYRGLNNITINNWYLQLRIDDLFDQLSGVKVFSKLDLKCGYHHMR